MHVNPTLHSCDCYQDKEWLVDAYQSPCVYTNTLKCWTAIYKFHFQNQHKEKDISCFFLTTFLTDIINILCYFQFQVQIFNGKVLYSIDNERILAEVVKELSLLLIKTSSNTSLRVPKESLIKVFELFDDTLQLLELYIFKNGICNFI